MTRSFGSVTSADGTIIGYHRHGSGPAIVLVHGAMQAAQNFSALAEALAVDFSVYVPDRRGRGRSGPFGDYGLAAECADLEALLKHSGARSVFGLSSGGVIALATACRSTNIDRLALYEPPLAKEALLWVPGYERAMQRGNLASAMARVIQGAGDREWITHVPQPILSQLLRLGIRAEAKRAKADDVLIATLIPTVGRDAALVREALEDPLGFDRLGAELLLLSGARSARYLQRAVVELGQRFPGARTVRLEGAGHIAADNHGRPLEVARHLRAFFRGEAPAE